MVYANPVEPEFASGGVYNQIGAEYYLSQPKLDSDYSPVRFHRELRLFRRYCKTGSVLDVGCSTGAFLYQLEQRCPGAYRRLGTDASGPALDYAESRGVPVARGSFLESSFGQNLAAVHSSVIADASFDAITVWAVLEHVADPAAFLNRAHSLLQPQGLCFVLVPNLRSIAVRLLGGRYRYIYPQHLNYFTRTTLRRLVEPWFEVVDCRSTHFNPLVIWQDWRRSGAEVSNSERAALLTRTTAYKQNPLLLPLKAVYQLAEGLLGACALADNLVMVLKKQNDAAGFSPKGREGRPGTDERAS
jgi:2-polyprenyl-3-methyl-5-hydroxy-6-metoxy-1,4-benzoquinol methylase